MADIEGLNALLTKQEEILKSINDKLPPLNVILTEVRLLEDIQKQISSSKNEIQNRAQRRFDFLWNIFLQMLGVAFVIIFGVFSALAYISAQTANSQSTNANQISLLFLCVVSSSNVTQDLCAEVLQNANHYLPSIVSALFASPTNTTNGTKPSTVSVTSHGLSTAHKIQLGLGIGIGAPVFIGLLSSCLVYNWKFHSARE